MASSYLMRKYFHILLCALIITAGVIWLGVLRHGGGANCVTTLRAIEAAKAQWSVDVRPVSLGAPAWEDLLGAGKYMKEKPVCPGGGNYTIGTLDEKPKCSLGKVVPGHELPGSW